MTPQFLVQASGWTLVPLVEVGSEEEEWLGGSTEFSWGAVEFEGAGRPASRPESGAQRGGESYEPTTGGRQGSCLLQQNPEEYVQGGQREGAFAGDSERE